MFILANSPTHCPNVAIKAERREPSGDALPQGAAKQPSD